MYSLGSCENLLTNKPLSFNLFLIIKIKYIVKESKQPEDKYAIRMNKAPSSYFSGVQFDIYSWRVPRTWTKEYLPVYFFPSRIKKSRFSVNSRF